MIDIRKRRLHLFIEKVYRQNHLAPRDIQIACNLILRRKGMYHVGNRTDAAERVEADKRLRCVGHADRHRVTHGNAGGNERPRRALYLCNKVAIACLFVVEFICRLVGKLLSTFLHQLKHCRFRVFKMIFLLIMLFFVHINSSHLLILSI